LLVGKLRAELVQLFAAAGRAIAAARRVGGLRGFGRRRHFFGSGSLRLRLRLLLLPLE